MGATEEQMELLDNAGITHVSYILILFSIAFILFLCKLIYSHIDPTLLTHLVVNILLHLYAVHAWPESADPSSEQNDPEQDGSGQSRGKHGMNGHARSPSETQHVHDAEAFELQGLISDEEEEGGAGHGHGDHRRPAPQKAEREGDH